MTALPPTPHIDVISVAVVLLAAALNTCALAQDGRIILRPRQGHMGGVVRAPKLGNQVFALGIPETIGCRERMILNFPEVKIHWDGPDDAGAISCKWTTEGRIRYAVRMTPAVDYVDIEMTIENLSDKLWRDVFAFNCLNPVNAKAFKDWKLEPFPEWQHDEATGEVSYRCVTKEGIEFGGRARPYHDEVYMEFRVKNGSDAALGSAGPQMCLSLARSKAFGKKLDIANIHTWIDGRFASFSETTPTPEQKGRAPWIQMLTKAMTNYRGPREHKAGWWFVDQTADHGILARVSEDRKHLLAITWEGAVAVMSNTRIPCLHAGTGRRGPIKPGEEVVWRGKIYLMDNDPKALLIRYKGDSGAWPYPERARPRRAKRRARGRR